MKPSKFLILAAVATSLMMVAATPALGAPPAADLDQARNGSATAPYTSVDYVNGNLGPSHAHFVEGYSVIYRAVMTDLPTDGTVIMLTLGYDIKHSDRHALDYLTHYDRINNPLHSDVFGHPPETIDPLAGVSGVSLTVSTWPIPKPSSDGSPVTDQPGDSYDDLIAAEGAGAVEMTLFGGNLNGIAYGPQGDLTAAQSETRIVVTFTADSSTAVLAWGGHIASRADWGYDSVGDPLSAGGISGSPYHMRLLEWNLNNLGNQDRSLQSASVYDPRPEPAVTIDKTADYSAFCEGADPLVTYTYVVTNTGEEDLENVVVTDDTCGPVAGPTGDDGDGLLNPGEEWEYTCSQQLTETTDNEVLVEAVGVESGDPVSDTSFWGVIEIPAPVVSVDPPEATICDGGSQEFCAVVPGDPLDFTYLWSPGGEITQCITVSAAGEYCVTVTEIATGCSAEACATLTVNPNPDCSIEGPDPVCNYSTSNEYCGPAGMADYSWAITSGDASIDGDNDTECVFVDVGAAGVFTLELTVTDEYGCSSTCDEEIAVYGDPDCSISGRETVCAFSSSQYCGPEGMTLYSWAITSGDASIDGAANERCVSVNVGAPGVFTIELSIVDEAGCENICSMEVTAEECAGFCGLTQGFWGNAGGTFMDIPTPDLIDALIASGADPVIVGIPGVRSITFDNSDCIIDLLPAGGPPRALPNAGFGDKDCDDLPNSIMKRGVLNNVLIGQVVALSLNVRLEVEGYGPLGDFELPEGYFCTLGREEGDCPQRFIVADSLVGLSVTELLALANDALAGGDTGDATIGEINRAVSVVNEAFDKCRIEDFCQETETDCDNGCDDDFDGATDCDDTDCSGDPACVT